VLVLEKLQAHFTKMQAKQKAFEDLASKALKLSE